jgi:NADH-quinone oxidoreductase subunit F
VIPEYREEETSLRGGLYHNKIQRDSSKKNLRLPPCQVACPVHQDARGYVALIGQGKFAEALELIKEVNPLPAVCGFICHHPCEEACLREEVDTPIPIRLLKRFVAEYDLKKKKGKRRILKKRREKILVVGSGPAGLSAAHDLCLLGYGVTIVEALPVLGGMLAVGIPEFRLPKEILRMEIDAIREMGVEMQTGQRFLLNGKDGFLQKLGVQAIFLSIGAHRSQKLDIPGEKLQGVFPGVEFLREINLGHKFQIGKRIAVIGGGNVALDVARSAIRLGAEGVEIYYRRSRNEMPAIPEEVDEAMHEGISIHFLTSPVKILGRGGSVVGMECLKMRLTETDEKGRLKPLPIKGSNYRVRADTIIAAIGQRVDRKGLIEFETHGDGLIKVDPETEATSIKGVFAGGDVVTGPGWAIDAIAAGKKGAKYIHQYLS